MDKILIPSTMALFRRLKREKNMYNLLMFITLAIFNLAFAKEDGMIDQNSVYLQIMQEEPGAILFQTEDKIYLQPESIRVTSQGIYVGNISISALHSNAIGCWLQRPVNYWFCTNADCSNYNQVYASPTGKCPVCGRAGDPC
jgi:hypothetical protein